MDEQTTTPPRVLYMAEAQSKANEVWKSLLNDHPNDVLLWLSSYFARTNNDFEGARRWIAMTPAERNAYINKQFGYGSS